MLTYRSQCVVTIHESLESLEREPLGSDSRLKKMKAVFKLLRGEFYESFPKKYPSFRKVVHDKAAEMRNPTTFYRLNASLESKVALINEAKKLQKRMAM